MHNNNVYSERSKVATADDDVRNTQHAIMEKKNKIDAILIDFV